MCVLDISLNQCLKSFWISPVTIVFSVLTCIVYYNYNLNLYLQKIDKFICEYLAKLLGMRKSSIHLKNIKENNISYSFKNDQLSEVLNDLKILIKQIYNDQDNKEKSKLKFASLVIDRFCLWSFSIVTFLSTIFILFTSKNFFKFS